VQRRAVLAVEVMSAVKLAGEKATAREEVGHPAAHSLGPSVKLITNLTRICAKQQYHIGMNESISIASQNRDAILTRLCDL
jgi:hypothetical protein